MSETYDDRLARIERECEEIRERRIEQAQRVTAGYTIDELRAMPYSALRRWELDRAALLDTLERIMYCLDNRIDVGPSTRLAARAAIAKAKGK